MTDLTMSQFASKDDLIATQAARIAELESELEAVGAGGVQRLSAAPRAVQAAVPKIKANCYSNDDGDYWRDCPDDCDFVDGLKVGDTYELQASIRSWSETFRVTKAPDETSDDYEVELVSSDAPAHPAEGVPAQAGPVGYVALAALTSRTHADDYAKCFATEAALLENYPAAKAIAVFDHAATQPAAQGINGREFPPLTPELASILGLMCFQCISFAQALRAAGHTIKTRAEDEQAAVLHWMLGHYFRHGADWRTAAAEDMKRMEAEALAAQPKQGGDHG